MATATRNRPPDDAQLQELLAGLTAVRGGDFSSRLPTGHDPLMNEIAAVFNAMNEQLAVFTSEVTRVSREVGNDGRLGGRAPVPAPARGAAARPRSRPRPAAGGTSPTR